ncbi:MAG: hypothetical protein AB7L91_06515 [Dehalococcoidia bacterium]
MRIVAAAIATVALLAGCSGSGEQATPSAVAPSVQTAAPTPTATATPLPFNRAAPVSDGLTLNPIALSAGTCDRGPALLLEAEISNTGSSYRRDIPTIEVRAPDNQALLNFVGFDDHPNFYTLPQGLPPGSTTRAFYCFGIDGRLGRGTYVGDLPPASFSGWIVDSQLGPVWAAE